MGESLSSVSSSKTYSSVWSHFSLVENEEKAECVYCGLVYYCKIIYLIAC
jgi:hypothetical protein